MASASAESSLLSGLNPEQARAVRHVDGPLLILAGAGSGKTRVLVHRIAHLIHAAGAPPWSILAITFTNKAAREMKSRVEALLPRESASIWISTFHTTCLRILRRCIDRLGFSTNFLIFDADDQLSLMKECIREMGLSDKMYVPKAMLDAIGRAKDALADPEQFRAMSPGDFRAAKICDIYQLYQAKLKKNNALDFDDIIMLTVRLLQEHADLLEYYQNRFRFILVDEYQDTNTAQYTLVRLLSGKWKNLCVVGDDDQSIYGWRGADISNILGFEKDFRGAEVIKLEQNYRSTQIILDAANSVIGKNTQRKAKSLWTANERGSAIFCATAPNEHEEALCVARMVKRLRGGSGGARWGDFCVLYRINAQSRAMENMLIREGVPYRIVGGFKFFERKEIKDVVAYLKLILNPSDDISFSRAVNVPRRGIGGTSLEKLGAFAQEGGMSLMQAARAADSAPGLKSAVPKLMNFAAMMDGFRSAAETLDTTALLDCVLERAGIVAMYAAEKTDEARTRLENVMELKSEILEFERNYQSDDIFFPDAQAQERYQQAAAGQRAPAERGALAGQGAVAGSAGRADLWEQAAATGQPGQPGQPGELAQAAGAEGGDSPAGGGAWTEDAESGNSPAGGVGGAWAARAGLAEFLAHVTLMADIDNFEEEDDRISLMTVHSAKGLEFDTVFIIGAEDGVFPGYRALTDSAQLEEERRLCYVAITRARKALCITNATSRTLFGNTAYNSPSRFISDIPIELVTKDAWLDGGFGQQPARGGYGAGGYGSAGSNSGASGAGGNGSSFGSYGGRPALGRRHGGAESGRGGGAAVGTAGGNAIFGKAALGAVAGAGAAGSAGLGNGGVAIEIIEDGGAAQYMNGQTYAIGESVNHKKFGRGTVASKRADGKDIIMEIEFDRAGLKRFIESMVSLQKLAPRQKGE
jgi:superfamily I DNA/RNA helicase